MNVVKLMAKCMTKGMAKCLNIVNDTGLKSEIVFQPRRLKASLWLMYTMKVAKDQNFPTSKGKPTVHHYAEQPYSKTLCYIN